LGRLRPPPAQSQVGQVLLRPSGSQSVSPSLSRGVWAVSRGGDGRRVFWAVTLTAFLRQSSAPPSWDTPPIGTARQCPKQTSSKTNDLKALRQRGKVGTIGTLDWVRGPVGFILAWAVVGAKSSSSRPARNKWPASLPRLPTAQDISAAATADCHPDAQAGADALTIPALAISPRWPSRPPSTILNASFGPR
jgi:hypothetical protein